MTYVTVFPKIIKKSILIGIATYYFFTTTLFTLLYTTTLHHFLTAATSFTTVLFCAQTYDFNKLQRQTLAKELN